MRPKIAVTVIVLFATGLAAQDGKKYESKEGKYSVAFPGKPEIKTQKIPGGDLNIASFEKGPGAFMVMYSDLPAEVVKATKAKEILEGGEKGLVDTFKAKVTSSKEIEFGKQKSPAREI